MEVRKGYKQTEVGVIPEDWSIKPIGSVCQIFGRIGFRGYTVNDIVENGQGAITLSPSNIQDNKLDLSGCTYISWFKYEESPEIMIFDGDILLVKTGSTFGKTAIVKNLKERATVNPQIVVLKKILIDNQYLSYVMSFDIVQHHIKTSIVGGAIPTLSQEQIKSFKIPLPPTKAEQTAIATALSDADALISSLERLIAKKRNIKQGAMQELLKPKDGWMIKKMAELGRPYGGLSGKSKSDFVDGNCPYIPFMNIMSNPRIDAGYLDYVTIKAGESQNQALKGDLFFNGSSETPEEVGMCSVLCDDIPDLYLNSFCFGFRLFKELKTDGLYLAYFFRSNEGRKLLFSLAQGATRYNLSKSNFLKMQLLVPKPEEQISIANTLRDMDAEIEALKTKLLKYKMIKQGMMQSLLTGQIRLI